MLGAVEEVWHLARLQEDVAFYQNGKILKPLCGVRIIIWPVYLQLVLDNAHVAKSLCVLRHYWSSLISQLAWHCAHFYPLEARKMLIGKCWEERTVGEPLEVLVEVIKARLPCEDDHLERHRLQKTLKVSRNETLGGLSVGQMHYHYAFPRYRGHFAGAS